MNAKELASYIVIAVIAIFILSLIGMPSKVDVEKPEDYGELISIEVDVWENYGYIRFIYENGVVEKRLSYGTNKIVMEDIL